MGIFEVDLSCIKDRIWAAASSQRTLFQFGPEEPPMLLSLKKGWQRYCKFLFLQGKSNFYFNFFMPPFVKKNRLP